MKRKHLVVIVIFLMIAGGVYYGSKLIERNSGHVQEGSRQVRVDQKSQSHDTATVPQANGQQKEEVTEEEEAPAVEIPEDKQQMLGVRTVVAAVQPLLKVIRTVGRVDYDERRLATVNTKIAGWIEKLYIDYTGKYVKKGEPLADLYSPELVATQQEFIDALAWAGKGSAAKNDVFGSLLSTDVDRIVAAARQRLKLWDITDEQIRKIAETGRPMRTLTLYSPARGYVVQKMAIQGMQVMPGEKLFDIADLSSVWVIADIYEYELPAVRLGQTAAITLSYFPGKVFSSKVEYIYPTLSGDTRTAKIRFTIANPGEQLKPQMFTNVELKIDLGKRLVIPEDAVIDTGMQQVVYVDQGDGYFEPRQVEVGVRASGMFEVRKGLTAGEKVASSATFLIDSEAKLKGIAPLGGHEQ